MHEDYLVETATGEPLAILEAADSTDAQLFAFRELKGAARVIPLPSTEAREKSLKESFTVIMGGDEKLAEIAAKGRDSGPPSLRRIVVPRQLAGGAHEELTEAQRERQEAISDGELEQSFRDMGFSEAAAKIAVEGRGRDNRLRWTRADQGATKPGVPPKRKPLAAAGNIQGLGFYESAEEREQALAKTFERMGLSESEAKIAAHGRERD